MIAEKTRHKAVPIVPPTSQDEEVEGSGEVGLPILPPRHEHEWIDCYY